MRSREAKHREVAGGPDIPRGVSRAALRREGAHWMLDAQADESAMKAPPGIVPALENAIAIINYLNQKAPRPASLAEISAALGISKSHCHSLLKTLVYFDWLMFDTETKFYQLQAGLLSDASSLLNSPALAIIRPRLAALTERIGFPTVLSEPLTDGSFVVVDRFNAPHIMEVSFPIGHRFPRDACAQMRAYLAWQSPEQVDQWIADWTPIRYTERTLTDIKAIREEIGATRRRGYSRSVGEFTDGLMAMAMPIFDRLGRVTHIFNCSSLVGVIGPHETEVAREMQRTASDIHRSLVSRTPPDFPA